MPKRHSSTRFNTMQTRRRNASSNYLEKDLGRWMSLLNHIRGRSQRHEDRQTHAQATHQRRNRETRAEKRDDYLVQTGHKKDHF